MPGRVHLDGIDRRILRLLQEDGRRRNVDLAEALNLTPAPCLRRVKALERAGVIRTYVALVDPNLVGLMLTAIVEIKLVSQARARSDSFEKEVSKFACVLECYQVTGDWDYILKVMITDLRDFQAFLVDRLTSLPEVQNLKSTIVLKSVKNTTSIAVPPNDK